MLCLLVADALLPENPKGEQVASAKQPKDAKGEPASKAQDTAGLEIQEPPPLKPIRSPSELWGWTASSFDSA